ncbi:MAG: glycosyltransferase [Gammaproteobacteria bacterium]
MRKILHLINGEHYAGAERVQDLLGQYLPQFGYESTFACLKSGMFETRRHGRDYEIIDLSMSSRVDLRSVFVLRELLRAGRFDLLHTHASRSGIIGAMALTSIRLPMVHHVHSPTHECTDNRLRNNLVSMAENLALKRADRFIAVSRSIEQYVLRQRMPSGSIRLVHNGVPACEQLPDRAAPGDVWALGMVALFRPRKGVEVLLRAIRLLLDRQRRVRLLAIGPFETPEYEQRIRALTTELGLDRAVQWLGFSDNVNDELQRTDVFVLPSLHGEGLPMVILEAMAAGTPVVASAIEGIPEVLEDANSGLLIPPGDPRALADALASLIDNDGDWLRIRRNAHRRQKEHFSAQSMAAGVARVYDELLADADEAA